ncbi:hypothetical protein [Pseudomonas veronii]|uniref:hypothetical protein n=1 Tax=Pseudomonas veronii TaxID=76761 RepID=UPI0015A20F78|nr:hypothetical protein [Pseudomonas veronii]NWC59524.1 hypothetical protein [Pseudomonas veronii]
MPKLMLPSLEVIEEGRSYLKSALVLEQTGGTNLWRPACVLAGFAMELFIKSFLAEDDSELADTVNGIDIYSGAVKSARGHYLDELFQKITPEWRQAILDTSERLSPGYPLEQKLAEFSGYFFNARYGYEAASIGIMRMEVLDVAEHLERVCTELLTKVYKSL